MARDTLVEGSTLTAIADAIREKTETSDVMYPFEMAGKIRGISGGIPVPDIIVAGDTIVKQSATREVNVGANGKVYNYTDSGVEMTMKKAGTYRFTYTCSKYYDETAIRFRLYKNGVSASGHSSSSNAEDDIDWDTDEGYGVFTMDITCQVGDFISVRYRNNQARDAYIHNLTAGITFDISNNDIF